MTDGRLNVNDQADTTRNTSPGDTSQRFQDDYHNTVGRVTDKTQTDTAGGDKPKFDNPIQHLNVATEAAKELQTLDGKKDTDKVQVEVAPGKFADETVAERRAELMKLAETEYKASIKAADNIDQKKVTDRLFELQNKETEIRTRLKDSGLSEDQIKASDEYKANQHLQDAITNMRHAPAAARFGYAQFLAEDKNDVLGAKKLMDKAIAENPEAKHEPYMQAFYGQLNDYIKQSQKDPLSESTPFDTLEVAEAKRQKGDIKGAEEQYKKALEQAGKISPDDISQTLTMLNQQRAELAKDPTANAAALKDLDAKEQGIKLLGHAQAVVRMNYADFLTGQKRNDEANKQLDAINKSDPEIAKTADFAQLRAAANGQAAPTDASAAAPADTKKIDDPYIHYQAAQEALKKNDVNGAEKELKAAVKAADALDTKPFQETVKLLDQKIAATSDAAAKADLQKKRDEFDQLVHSDAFMRMQLGRFELANKNYLAAKSLFQDVQHDDPDFANRPGTQMKELMEATTPNSKLTETLKDIGKSVLCDAVAIGAGVLTGVATGWSGPGAILAGGAAGTAAYMGMRGLLYGEKPGFNKQTAINAVVGFADGVSLGTAGLVADGLREGAVLGTKEIAQQAVLKTGGKLAALESVEAAEGGAKTLQYMSEAQKIAKEALALSKGTMTEAELSAAKSALRSLTMRNMVTKGYINAATAGTMSLVYRGSHEGANYYEGKYKSFGEFSKALGTKVAVDTVSGVGWGGFTYLGGSRAVGFDFLSKGASTFVAASPLMNDGMADLTIAAANTRQIVDNNTPTKPNDLNTWYRLHNEAPGKDAYVNLSDAEAPAQPADTPVPPSKDSTASQTGDTDAVVPPADGTDPTNDDLKVNPDQ